MASSRSGLFLYPLGVDGNMFESSAVTAARRNHNLETIKRQDGWQDFPDCLPSALRTTKGGKMTDFGNTKLRIIERISLHADFHAALAYFMRLTQGGTRILRLKDLETCADYFENRSITRLSENLENEQESDSTHRSEVQSDIQQKEPSEETSPPDAPKPRDLDATTTATYPARPSQTPRSHDSATDHAVPFANAYPAKRQRIDNVEVPPHPQSLSFIVNQDADAPDTRVFGSMYTPTSSLIDVPLASKSPTKFNTQDPCQSPRSEPEPVFSAVNRAFDELALQVKDQNRLISLILEQRAALESSLTHPEDSIGNLENDLLQAREVDYRARQDLEQATVALESLRAQYGDSDSSLSRALLATVGNEYNKAQHASLQTKAEVQRLESALSQARARHDSLPAERATVDESVAQLKSQTRFWLKRLAEVGVELSSQLSRLS